MGVVLLAHRWIAYGVMGLLLAILVTGIALRVRGR